jgi:hypothetical protein
VSEPNLGVPGWVTFNRASLIHSWGLKPELVEHSTLGITWLVTEILDSWQHPGQPRDLWGQATAIRWWRLKVSGPLPGRPAERGEFIMEITKYGDPPGWWITAG